MISDFHYITSILCAALLLSAGVYVLAQDARAYTHRAFMGACLSIAIWMSYYFVFYHVAEDSVLGRFWLRFFYCGVTYIIIFLFDYVVHLFNVDRFKAWARRNYIYGLMISVLMFKTDWFVAGVYQYRWGMFPKAGPLHPYYLAYYFFLIGMCHVILLRRFSDKTEDFKVRNHARYVFTAFVILSSAALDFVPNYGIDLYPWGSIPVTVFVLIIAYAVVKHHLMDISVVIRKSIMYSMLISVLTVVYLMAVVISERMFQNIVGYKNLPGSLLTVIVMALIFTPLKNLIQDFVDKTFFKGTPMQIAEENVLLRREIVRTDRYKTLASVIDGITHEIKDPLTTLINYNYLLPKKLDDPGFLAKFSEVFGREINKIKEMVQNLSNYSQPAPLALQRTDILKLINDTLDMLKDKFISHQITVYKYYAAGAVFNIDIDPQQIRQALLNILLNAVESMPEGGQIWVGARRHGREFHISIKDIGCGISPEHLSKIFDPFFRLKEQNKGFGLSVVQSIIEEHGGRIDVESEVDAGAEFIVKLPVT